MALSDYVKVGCPRCGTELTFSTKVREREANEEEFHFSEAPVEIKADLNNATEFCWSCNHTVKLIAQVILIPTLEG
jgi:hypothetical protein